MWVWNSGDTDVGMSRLSLSDADKQARDWFAETTQSLGCKVTVDAMGNQFAVRPGMNEGNPVYAGSHLDTQPTVSSNDDTLHLSSADVALGWPIRRNPRSLCRRGDAQDAQRQLGGDIISSGRSKLDERGGSSIPQVDGLIWCLGRVNTPRRRTQSQIRNTGQRYRDNEVRA